MSQQDRMHLQIPQQHILGKAESSSFRRFEESNKPQAQMY